MNESGTYRIPKGLHKPASTEDIGRVQFDERGNAVWTPRVGVDAADAVRQLLEHPALSIAPDAPVANQPTIAANPTGLPGGYNPYDSGRLDKKKWQSKKDLRRLSQWIVRNRKADSGNQDSGDPTE